MNVIRPREKNNFKVYKSAILHPAFSELLFFAFYVFDNDSNF